MSTKVNDYLLLTEVKSVRFYKNGRGQLRGMRIWLVIGKGESEGDMGGIIEVPLSPFLSWNLWSYKRLRF